MSTYTIVVHDRRGQVKCTLLLPLSATTTQLKQAFATQFRNIYPDRQYFTIGTDKNRIVLAIDQPLSNYFKDPSVPHTIVFKDLGPQISWKTVFHVEYFGPILIHALFYFFPQLFYSGVPASGPNYSYTQTVAFWCVIFHYVKRELETHFVHRFSNATMPAFNIFKNSFHYWILSGVFIAYFLYHPLYTETKSHLFVTVSAGLFLLMELGNLYSHLQLMWLRPKGTRERKVPRGFLFELVTCANYTFELAAWLVFCVMVQTLTAWLFFLVSAGQISLWSIKKHVALKKEFGAAVPKRKILVPFIW